MNPISEYTVSHTHIVLIRSYGIYESFVLLTRVALTLKVYYVLSGFLTDDDNVAIGVIIEQHSRFNGR